MELPFQSSEKGIKYQHKFNSPKTNQSNRLLLTLMYDLQGLLATQSSKIQIKIDQSKTIKQLIETIQSENSYSNFIQNISDTYIQLMAAGKFLDEKKLISQSLTHEQNFFILNFFEIHLENEDGEKIKILTKGNERIIDFKKKLNSNQYLYHKYKVLDDFKTFVENDVISGDVISFYQKIDLKIDYFKELKFNFV